jgi:hypothetical protein
VGSSTEAEVNPSFHDNRHQAAITMTRSPLSARKAQLEADNVYVFTHPPSQKSTPKLLLPTSQFVKIQATGMMSMTPKGGFSAFTCKTVPKKVPQGGELPDLFITSLSQNREKVSYQESLPSRP